MLVLELEEEEDQEVVGWFAGARSATLTMMYDMKEIFSTKQAARFLSHFYS
jgi:hypothetical protein